MPTHRDLTTLWTKTSAGSAPTDSTIPTADTEASDANGVRGSRFVIELDSIVSAGAGTGTVDIYLWDPRRPAWVKSSVSIPLAFTATTRGPASRLSYEVDNIAPYGAICPVLSAITGTDASVICRCASRG